MGKGHKGTIIEAPILFSYRWTVKYILVTRCTPANRLAVIKVDENLAKPIPPLKFSGIHVNVYTIVATQVHPVPHA
jgi:hypothetical protein